MSFAVARLIGGLPQALEPERRYWIHAVWVVSAIANLVLSWWLIFMYREVDWTFVLFALWLTPTGFLLYSANILVPENADGVESWRDHFYTIRKRLMGANIGFAAAIVAINGTALEPQAGQVLGPIPGAVFLAVGYRFESERVQSVVAVSQLAVILGLMVMFNER